jgi:FkbM family methyltransferase
MVEANNSATPGFPMPTAKQRVQALLSRIGLYERLRGSCLYDIYWFVVDKRVIVERSVEVDFYATLLKGFRKNDLIFDVGANHGVKTDVFLRLGARVVAVEPDEANQAILRQRFLSYRVFRKALVVVQKALSDSEAVETMWIDAPGSAKNTLSRKWVDTLRDDKGRFGYQLDFSGQKNVETTTLEQLMVEHGVPFFIKIDVEGFEPQVVRGLRRRVPFLSFEVNLPEFRPEGLECVELLGRVAEEGTFNYAVDCRDGLMLERWVNAREFVSVLENCDADSIEVFWTTLAEGKGCFTEHDAIQRS